MKLGRRPPRQSPSSVNWLTTRIPPSNVEHAPVHLARVVLEAAQVEHLFGHPGGISLGVALGDPEQNQPALANSADARSVDFDRRPDHSLQDCTHLRKSAEIAFRRDDSCRPRANRTAAHSAPRCGQARRARSSRSRPPRSLRRREARERPRARCRPAGRPAARRKSARRTAGAGPDR